MEISSVKPYTMSLRKFYDEESNAVFIPSIQRDFVWEVDQVRELVESIISNYPIGSIILWETSGVVPASKLYDGDGQKVEKKAEKRYVIDGQQRLTSLVLLKNHWKINRDNKGIAIESIRYVPETRSFTVGRLKGIDLSEIIDAALANPVALTNLQKNFPKQFQGAIQDVGARLLNYEIPFYSIKTEIESGTDIYEKIADIFTRVNSAGTQIGNLEMFLSFFAAAFPKGQKEKIMKFHDDVSRTYGLDLEPIIRFVFSELGMTQYQITKTKSFKAALKYMKEKYEKNERELDSVISRCFLATKIVMELLSKDFGFNSTKYLPSQNIIVPLFDFVFRSGIRNLDELKPAQRKKMHNWLLIGSFHALYSGSPTAKLTQDLKITGTTKGIFPYDSMIRRIRETVYVSKIRREDLQSGYTGNVSRSKNYLMLLFALLHNKKATNWAGHILNFDNVTVHHIFPRDYLIEESIDQPEKINSLCNLTFISQSANSSIGNRSPEDYLPEYDSKVLSAHLIPSDKSLWKVRNFDRFLKTRFQLLWEETKTFFR